MSWHVPQPTLVAYVQDRVADAEAWSVEAHLVECEDCRRRAAAAMTGATADAAARAEAAAIVDRAWNALPSPMPRQGRVRRASRFRAAVVLAASGPGARGAWLLSALVVLAMITMLDLTGSQVGVVGAPSGVSWLTLLAPVLPVLGVAAVYDSGLDDAHEVVVSTPSSGLRLLLWRTLAVLAVTLPAALLAGVLTSTGSPADWLLPAVALTTLTLAVGSVIGLLRAAVVVGLAWAVAVAGPALADGAVVPTLLAADPVALWLPIAGVSAAVVALRAPSFSHLSSHHLPESEA